MRLRGRRTKTDLGGATKSGVPSDIDFKMRDTLDSLAGLSAQLPKFSFRHYEGPGDVLAMLRVQDACRERDCIDPLSVCYTAPNRSPDNYAACVARAPDGATLLVTAGGSNGQVVAHAFMEAWGIDERLYLWMVWVSPECRGQDLGTAMLHWGEQQARELHGDDPRPALHLANATEGERDAVTLLTHENYRISFISPELARNTRETLPEPEVIAGISIRPLEASDHGAVARALSEANLNPPRFEDRFTGSALKERLDLEEVEWLERVQTRDPQLCPIAWDGDAVAGAYLCRRSGEVGEIAQVAVRAPWRGRGVARALAMTSLRQLHNAGCTTARLFTSIGPDEEEPEFGPYAMYRKFGFTPISRHIRFRKPLVI